MTIRGWCRVRCAKAYSPDAIRALLDHGFAPGLIRYHRGAIHDWMTLGYPTVRGEEP